MAQRHRLGNWTLSTKGYPRFCSGKYRNKYVHRVVMAKKLRRKLRRDEQVHHRNFNKLDFRLRNLQVLGTREHGYVSAKQAWWMKFLDIKQQKDWDDYFDSGVQFDVASV